MSCQQEDFPNSDNAKAKLQEKKTHFKVFTKI